MDNLTTAINQLLTLILGKHLALRLGFYNPPGISPNNLIVHSFIYGIDDVPQRDDVECDRIEVLKEAARAVCSGCRAGYPLRNHGFRYFHEGDFVDEYGITYTDDQSPCRATGIHLLIQRCKGST